MSALYRTLAPKLKYVAEHLLRRDETQGRRERNDRIRVGFVSKFLTVNHAHGQLLEGVISHLPRTTFEVVAIAIPNSQTAVLDSIRNGSDVFVTTSLNFFEVRETIAKLELDVLVYADFLSEPITHFLVHSRLARVQCVFWGNPITTGTDTIDYYMSGEYMERKDSEQDYTEQVVLLPGQGIWYDRIPFPHTALKALGGRVGSRVHHFKPFVPSEYVLVLTARSWMMKRTRNSLSTIIFATKIAEVSGQPV